MGNLTESLMEELNCETVFTIPIFGGIGVSESVVVTWIIMAVMVLVAFILTRNLRIDHISKRQAVAETIVTKLTGMVEDMTGPEGKRYVPYLTTVLVYIGLANIIGLFGFKSPTKDLNVTAALAIMSIVLVEGAGILEKQNSSLKIQNRISSVCRNRFQVYFITFRIWNISTLITEAKTSMKLSRKRHL